MKVISRVILTSTALFSLLLASPLFGSFADLGQRFENAGSDFAKAQVAIAAIGRTAIQEEPSTADKALYVGVIEAISLIEAIKDTFKVDKKAAKLERTGAMDYVAMILTGDFSGIQAAVGQDVTVARESAKEYGREKIKEKVGTFKEKIIKNYEVDKKRWALEQVPGVDPSGLTPEQIRQAYELHKEMPPGNPARIPDSAVKEVEKRTAKKAKKMNFLLGVVERWLTGESTRPERCVIWLMTKIQSFTNTVRKMLGREPITASTATKRIAQDLFKEMAEPKVQKFMEGAREAIEYVKEKVTTNIDAGYEVVVDGITYSIEFAEGTRDMVIKTTIDAKDFVLEKAANGKDFVLKSGEAVIDIAAAAKDATVQSFSDGLTALQDTVTSSWDAVSSKISETGSHVMQVSASTVEAARSTLDAGREKISDIARSTVETANSIMDKAAAGLQMVQEQPALLLEAAVESTTSALEHTLSYVASWLPGGEPVYKPIFFQDRPFEFADVVKIAGQEAADSLFDASVADATTQFSQMMDMYSKALTDGLKDGSVTTEKIAEMVESYGSLPEQIQADIKSAWEYAPASLLETLSFEAGDGKATKFHELPDAIREAVLDNSNWEYTDAYEQKTLPEDIYHQVDQAVFKDATDISDQGTSADQQHTQEDKGGTTVGEHNQGTTGTDPGTTGTTHETGSSDQGSQGTEGKTPQEIMEERAAREREEKRQAEEERKREEEEREREAEEHDEFHDALDGTEHGTEHGVGEHAVHGK